MKIARIIAWLAAALLAACSKGPVPEPDRAAAEGAVTLHVGLRSDALSPLDRSGSAERIARMWYAIADGDGVVVEKRYATLSDDLSSLRVEGLSCGDYTFVFLATTDPSPEAEVRLPGRLTDAWLVGGAAGAPLDELFFYGRMELHIGREQTDVERSVMLERCVGRVDVDLSLTSEYMWRFIRRIRITFDNPEGFQGSLTAGGDYAGVRAVEDYDITESCSFLTLPGREVLSGYVTVDSERSDGSTFSRRYRFEDCAVEAGRIAHIGIEYLHPENREGLLHVREEDYPRFRPDTMFLSSEPREVFYDASRRSFRPDAPLQVSISENHRLVVKLYSPVAVRDVAVYCRFDRLSAEFFELARFDAIYPFMEGEFPLPVVASERTFTTSDGRKVVIPAQPDLSAEDVTLEIRTDDPFMRKVATIDSRWNIRFAAYSADDGHAYWRHMTPLLCRHGVALALNMSFMFASEEFNEEMQLYKGRLTDNDGNPIDLNVLRERIRQHGGLVLGCVSGVGGLGGGTTYGLADYCYTGVYFDATPPDAHPHNYPRQAMFHEYGHCLGYNHSSTMTYGDQWTVLCATVFVRMGREGKLPVCSKDEVGNLPM